MTQARQVFSLLIVAVMLGCSATMGTTPQTRVFGAQQDYKAALIVANAYAKMPLCTPSVPQPCADLDIVRHLQKMQPIVRDALEASEAAVRNPKFEGDIADKAIVVCHAALAAMTSITNRLKSEYPVLVPSHNPSH